MASPPSRPQKNTRFFSSLRLSRRGRGTTANWRSCLWPKTLRSARNLEDPIFRADVIRQKSYSYASFETVHNSNNNTQDKTIVIFTTLFNTSSSSSLEKFLSPRFNLIAKTLFFWQKFFFYQLQNGNHHPLLSKCLILHLHNSDCPSPDGHQPFPVPHLRHLGRIQESQANHEVAAGTHRLPHRWYHSLDQEGVPPSSVRLLENFRKDFVFQDGKRNDRGSQWLQDHQEGFPEQGLCGKAEIRIVFTPRRIRWAKTKFLTIFKFCFSCFFVAAASFIDLLLMVFLSVKSSMTFEMKGKPFSLFRLRTAFECAKSCFILKKKLFIEKLFKN